MKTQEKDYYAILVIPRDATPGEIKRAYRKLAKRYHPDVNNSPDAAERFRELTEAYDTLVDPDRRRRYDRLHGTGTEDRTTGAGSSPRDWCSRMLRTVMPERRARSSTRYSSSLTSHASP